MNASDDQPPTWDVSITSGALTLKGVLHLPGRFPCPAVAVCHPHPLYGGDMDNNVVTSLCEAIAGRGIAALRFNFRGVGGSDGSFGDGIGERADARAALAYLRRLAEVDQERIGIVGYSFGAAVALLEAGDGVNAVVAVSVPTIARDLSEIGVSCPALLVVGERDQVAPPERLAGLRDIAGFRTAFVTVPGADHFWCGAEEQLAATVSDFLARVLGGE